MRDAAGIGLKSPRGAGDIPAELPVFAIAPARVTDEHIDRIARACGMPVYSAIDHAHGVRLISGARELEVDRVSGQVWMVDRSRLWNPTLPPPQRLLAGSELTERARATLGAAGLGPATPPGFILDARLVDRSGTHCAVWERGRRGAPASRRDWRSDSFASLEISIAARNGRTWGAGIPVIGPGCRAGVTFTGEGAVIGLNAAWPALAGDRSYAVLPPSDPDDDGRSGGVSRGPSTLAYEVLEVSSDERYLHPVWLHHPPAGSQEGHDADRTAGPVVIRPATEFAEYIRGTRGKPVRSPAPIPAAADRVVGAWWIDHTLQTRQNAEGLIDELAADGWTVGALRGEDSALRSDWLDDADRWAERVDLAYYAGHATERGWRLRPGNTYLEHADLDPAGDASNLFGRGRLKWIVVSACGPLQDAVLPEGRGDAFARWSNAFRGLHALCGFANQIGDRSGTGRDMAALTRRGETLIHSWLRGARQGEPVGGVWASAMWAGLPNGESAFWDCLPGHGPVSETCHAPDRLGAIWTPA